MDRGMNVDSVYVDLKKAFDSVDHASLFIKLQRIGIRGQLLQWIKSWLNKRKQRVVLNGEKSSWKEVKSGVPQGSVLGPLLFIIFINDMPDGLINVISLFADDLKLFSSDRESLQEDLVKLEEWLAEWKMKANPQKCSVIHFGRTNQKHKYEFCGEQLQSSRAERDLGFMVQDNLKVSDHVQKVLNKCNQLIGMIKRSFTCKDSDLMVRIFKIYLLPHLDFCAPLWNSLTKEESDKIEGIQRKFTRFITGCHGLSYEERLTLLELVPLSNRRQYLDLIQAYRLINKIDEMDHDVFSRDQGSRQTRSSNKFNVREENCRLNLRKNFFTCRVGHEWNKLPEDIQKSNNIEDFKIKIKNFLFC